MREHSTLPASWSYGSKTLAVLNPRVMVIMQATPRLFLNLDLGQWKEELVQHLGVEFGGVTCAIACQATL